MISMGKTTVICRNCGAVTVVENADLETMTEFRCAGCGVPMSAVRFAQIKMSYYAQLIRALTAPPFGGAGPEMFQVTMTFDPHQTEPDRS